MTTPNGGSVPGGRGPGEMFELATVTPPAQANPDMWHNAEQARSFFSLNILSGFLSIGHAIGQALEDLANALFGSGDGAPLLRLEDGMTELNQRIDLMTDVSGYGGMMMSRRRLMTGGYKVVPFDTQYGPHTPGSVTVDTANHRFVLARGTWSINVLLTVLGAGGINPPAWHRATITSYYPDGREHMNQWLDWRSGENPHAYFAQVPLVVPEDGYYVQIRYQANGTQWNLEAGTDRSKFWVNRWDLRTDNNNVIINPGAGPDV